MHWRCLRQPGRRSPVDIESQPHSDPHVRPDAQAGARLPLWTWLTPLVAAMVLVCTLILHMGAALALIAAPALIGAVLAAVHHAEAIARRLRQPFGTLLLSVALTAVEVALLAAITYAGDPEKAMLVRDTIFAEIMLACNGLVGLSLFIGTLRHREQPVNIMGANASLATMIVLASLSLVLPSFTFSSGADAIYTPGQLSFAALASLVLWASFVFMQTVTHRHYFLPVGAGAPDYIAIVRVPLFHRVASLALLLISLIVVVGLAHEISGPLEAGLLAAGAPRTIMSIVIALLTLLPEGLAALRAARADQLQTSVNLALGSAIASIGLTIPVVALGAMLLGIPLVLGLAPKELVLLVLTFLVTSITLLGGRTYPQQGVVHLILFGAFLVFALLP